MTFRVLLLFIALSLPALAYLDPVTGNILVQAILAGCAALALGYHRIKIFLGSLFGKKKDKDKEPETKTEEKAQKDEAEANPDIAPPAPQKEEASP